MLTSRFYVASTDALHLENALLQSPLFVPVGCAERGAKALDDVRSLCPDLLILDGALPGLDGLALLDAMRNTMAAPPRVLFLCRMGDAWAKKAKEKGADSVMDWPNAFSVLLSAAESCADLPLPALAAPMAKTRLEIAAELLTRLDVPTGLKGRDYMLEAAASAACAPQLLLSYTGRLYPFLAERFSTTPLAVERAVRTAIEHTWLKGDLQAIQALFGFSVDADRGKPTNAEFLAMLSEHVRRETMKRLESMGSR